MKIFITFGQEHVHRVNNQTFDHNCVMGIECADEATGRQLAVDAIGLKWGTSYPMNRWDELGHYFPRGIIPLNYTESNE